MALSHLPLSKNELRKCCVSLFLAFMEAFLILSMRLAISPARSPFFRSMNPSLCSCAHVLCVIVCSDGKTVEIISTRSLFFSCRSSVARAKDLIPLHTESNAIYRKLLILIIAIWSNDVICYIQTLKEE